MHVEADFLDDYRGELSSLCHCVQIVIQVILAGKEEPLSSLKIEIAFVEVCEPLFPEWHGSCQVCTPDKLFLSGDFICG